jgi:HPt (histidine-containing phosphotransfer) domain-containing protein
MVDGKQPDPIGSQLLRDDPSFADIVSEFVNGLSGRLTAMEEAIRDADFEALRVAAHQLKGSGGGYGYPVLSEKAAKLEQYAGMQAQEDCVNSFNDLKELCARVVVEPG